MTKALTLRLTPTQMKQLELVKAELGEATSSKAVLRLINERIQIRINMESDSEQIRSLKETVYTYKTMIRDYSESLSNIKKAASVLSSDVGAG